jgi:fatty acid desaturase
VSQVIAVFAGRLGASTVDDSEELSPEDVQERARDLWVKIKARFILYGRLVAASLVVAGAVIAVLWGWWGLAAFTLVLVACAAWIGRHLLNY